MSQVFKTQPVVTHLSYARKVLKLAKYFALSDPKGIRDKLLEFQFTPVVKLGETWKQLMLSLRDIISPDEMESPSMQDFQAEFKRLFHFDHQATDEVRKGFSIPPQVWNLHELNSKKAHSIQSLNIANEFTIHLLDRYFHPAICKDVDKMDMRTIVDKLKKIESDMG